MNKNLKFVHNCRILCIILTLLFSIVQLQTTETWASSLLHSRSFV